MTYVTCKSKLRLFWGLKWNVVASMPRNMGGNRIMPGLPTHLELELNVDTGKDSSGVCVTTQDYSTDS